MRNGSHNATPLSSFADGIVRGAGIALPGILIAGAVFYRNQHLAPVDQVMVIGVVALLLFAMVGYATFHKSLYPRFGRLSLFCFVTWALLVTLFRVANIFDLIDTNMQRLLNTAFAVLFAGVLSYVSWWHPALVSVLGYLFGQPLSAAERMAELVRRRQEADTEIAAIAAEATAITDAVKTTAETLVAGAEIVASPVVPATGNGDPPTPHEVKT